VRHVQARKNAYRTMTRKPTKMPGEEGREFFETRWLRPLRNFRMGTSAPPGWLCEIVIAGFRVLAMTSAQIEDLFAVGGAVSEVTSSRPQTRADQGT
jgi:hypothetical protein